MYCSLEKLSENSGEYSQTAYAEKLQMKEVRPYRIYIVSVHVSACLSIHTHIHIYIVS